jgi:gamma-glutamyltranspeptidase/glutathione hydrolase
VDTRSADFDQRPIALAKRFAMMRDFHLPGRSAVYALNALAATSHPHATLAAVQMLREGGNAVDAAIAASAVLAVVEPQQTSIGGDSFALIAPARTGKVFAYNGAGRSPAALTLEALRAAGQSRIEPESAHAVTIPGTVECWGRLAADYGTKSAGELLKSAINCAEDGCPVHERVAFDWRRNVDRLARRRTSADLFLRNGSAPIPGEIHRQPRLAKTLRILATEGWRSFYEGTIAENLVSCLRLCGGLHTKEDFAEAKGEYVVPLCSPYAGYEIHQCPPNGQGIVTLIAMRILEHLDWAPLRNPLCAKQLQREIEAVRLAMLDRDRFVGDPAHSIIPIEYLLSESHISGSRQLVLSGRPSDWRPATVEPRPTPSSNTVYVTVVDQERNVVSLISSIFHFFGSGLACPETGILLHSRGAGFVMEAGHPNCVAPRKRPLNTIMPGLLVKDGRPVMSFGVMGGDYQPYGQVRVLSGVIDSELNVQSAIDLPRIYPNGGYLEVERGVPPSVCTALVEMGYKVVMSDLPHGGGQAIWIDWDTGVLVAGSDGRKDGCAFGY